MIFEESFMRAKLWFRNTNTEMIKFKESYKFDEWKKSKILNIFKNIFKPNFHFLYWLMLNNNL